MEPKVIVIAGSGGTGTTMTARMMRALGCNLKVADDSQSMEPQELMDWLVRRDADAAASKPLEPFTPLWQELAKPTDDRPVCLKHPRLGGLLLKRFGAELARADTHGPLWLVRVQRAKKDATASVWRRYKQSITHEGFNRRDVDLWFDEHTRDWDALMHRCHKRMTVWYQDVVDHPIETAERLAEFIGTNDQDAISRAAQIPDPQRRTDVWTRPVFMLR
jgi:hypothetical protein